MAMADQPLTKVIKQMIAIRAKYKWKEEESEKYWKFLDIAPHPKNRGCDVIKSARTRELCAQIFEDGLDPIEGSLDNLAVHAGRLDTGEIDPRFTKHYMENAGKDPDHYIVPWRVNGITENMRRRICYDLWVFLP